MRRGVWNGLAAREGVKKRAYGGKKQAYTETRTQTPDLGARRGVWNGLAAREGVKMRAYAGNKTPNPPISAREGGSGTGCYSGTRGCRNVPAVEEAGQHGDYNPDPRSRREKGGRKNPGPRARREKGGLERARLRWKEAGLHGDCDPDPQTRRETGGLAAREGVKKRARLRRKEAGLHGDYNPDPRSRREKGGLDRVCGTRGCE